MSTVIESVCVIPSTEGHDQLWLTVRRIIDGQTVRYVELINEDEWSYVGVRYKPIFYVDCGSVYEGAAATTITGLDYLEGETVAVLADGISVGPKVVSGGQITLETAATKVMVGLPYTTTVKTIPPDPSVVKKRALNPVLHFIDTGKGAQFGPDPDRLKDVPDIDDGELGTLDVPVSLPGGYDTEGQIIVEMSKPLPMFLASILYDITGGD